MDEFNQGPRNEEEKPDIQEPEKVQETEKLEEPIRYRESTSKPKRRGGFLPALLGAILGGLIVWLLINFTADKEDQTQQVKNETTGENNLTSERVSMDINTDVTDIVSEVADTVVGITNLQTVRDFWSVDGKDEGRKRIRRHL